MRRGPEFDSLADYCAYYLTIMVVSGFIGYCLARGLGWG